jgi:hypothetical protein
MADAATGPWTYKGSIMDGNSNSSGNQPGIFDYKGKSYTFGFNYAINYSLTTVHNERRSVCLATLTYNADGTIPKLPWFGGNLPEPGVPQVGTLNPYDTTQAETICFEKGVRTEVCTDGGGGMDVDSIHNGDFIKVKGADFGAGGAKLFEARVASAASGGGIEIHLDTTTGPLAGTCAVAGTGGWQTWATNQCSITGASGVHNVYFKFTGGSGMLFNFNWWKFTSSVAIGSAWETKKWNNETAMRVVANAQQNQKLVVDFSRPFAQGNARVCLYDLTGRLVTTLFDGGLKSSHLSLPINRMAARPGAYFARVTLDNATVLTKTITLR